MLAPAPRSSSASVPASGPHAPGAERDAAPARAGDGRGAGGLRTIPAAEVEATIAAVAEQLGVRVVLADLRAYGQGRNATIDSMARMLVIARLTARGWTTGEIGRVLGVRRKAVRRLVLEWQARRAAP